jgi:cell division protein FtsQ
MDGGGRLLGSVGAGGDILLADGPSFRFPSVSFSFFSRRSETRAFARAKRFRKNKESIFARTWVSLALVAGVLGGTLLYGSHLGGGYDRFVAENGSPLDLLGKLMGFEIDTISISGLEELNQKEVLDAAGLSDRNSLLFLDAAEIRNRLRTVPLVRDVTVRKLFPNTLLLHVDERDAAAVWQKDGQLSVVAGDGVAIDGVHDARFNSLPFVVGPGANEHLGEFKALLDAAGDLKDRITAGIYVGERRWTLKMDSGVEVMLPEIDPKTALTRLAALDRSGKIVDKDVLWLDLRMPGRITARLSEDAAAARAAMLAKRPKKVMKE